MGDACADGGNVRTGPAPLPGVCPGVLDDGTIMSLPLPNVRKATREVRVRMAQHMYLTFRMLGDET